MTKRARPGMPTPSSSTTLEPGTCSMLASLSQVGVHCARLRITEIALTPGALGQFDDSLAAVDDQRLRAGVDSAGVRGRGRLYSHGADGHDTERR